MDKAEQLFNLYKHFSRGSGPGALLFPSCLARQLRQVETNFYFTSFRLFRSSLTLRILLIGFKRQKGEENDKNGFITRPHNENDNFRLSQSENA